jgi:hypothetical protein
MTQEITGEQIALCVDLPELELASGEVGRVVSIWLEPDSAYEVEFPAKSDICARRVLLLPNWLVREPHSERWPL